MDLELKEMENCLREAGAYDADMNLQEMKQLYRAINTSRNSSETVDLDESDNEDSTPKTRTICMSVPSDNAHGAAGAQWLSKGKGAVNTKFKYKIPKKDSTPKITPLEDLDEISSDATATTSRVLLHPPTPQQRSLVPLAQFKALNTTDTNEFAALDNGNIRDFPLVIKFKYPRVAKQLSPELAAMSVPPPYADPRYANLSSHVRHEIIGKYMRDMNAELVSLCRASKKKAPWGKGIFPSNHFNGSLDKYPSVNRQLGNNHDLDMEVTKENSSEDNAHDKSVSSSPWEYLNNTFQDLERETNAGTDSVERKAMGSHQAGSLSSSSEGELDDDADPDFESAAQTLKKKAKVINAAAKPKSQTEPIPDQSSGAAASYATLLGNRPGVTMKGGVRGGRGRVVRGARGKGAKSCADIMARSALFQDSSPSTKVAKGDSPIVKTVHSSRWLDRNRRLIDLAQLEEDRKVEAAKQHAKLKESLSKTSADHLDDDETVAQISDDDNSCQTLFDKLKRQRVPVPVPKCRPGVPRMARLDFTQKVTNDDDIIEVDPTSIISEDEEQPCPMCNVMFKISDIQEHAETCEGPESMDTGKFISCAVCDQVFLLNTDYEVHTKACILKAKARNQ